MDPKEFAAWFNKGNLQVRLGDFKSALASYTTAADLAPGISGKACNHVPLSVHSIPISRKEEGNLVWQE